MKKDGEICWVATSSPKCLAVSSTDTAPALLALGAKVRSFEPHGERELALADLYRNDGIEYLTRRPDEILTEVRLDLRRAGRARTGSCAGVVLSTSRCCRSAAAVRFEGRGAGARHAKRASSWARSPRGPSWPTLPTAFWWDARRTTRRSRKRPCTQRRRRQADGQHGLRPRLAQACSTRVRACALRELRGDDQRAVRERYTRHGLMALGTVA
jgi:hypothetical protein